MTRKQALLQKLREDAPGSKPIEEHLEEQKQRWIADLRELMERLAGFLTDAEAEGLLKIERRAVEVAEEDLGPYEAPGLSIHVRTKHPRTVKVQPRGMRVFGVVGAAEQRIVGAQGRVDLTAGAARTILLRWKKKAGTSWQMVLPSGETTELTEETFSKALGELIE